MSSSIDNFKTNFLKNGIASPTRYEVRLTGPEETITFQPESVMLPARSMFQIKDDLFFGPKRNQPLGQDFTGQVVLVFPVSETQGERTFFEAWMDKIVHPTTQRAIYRSGSSGRIGEGSMEIKTLRRDDTESSRYEFYEAYPVTIMPTQLTYAARDDYTRLTVAMEFRRYTYHSDDYDTPG